MLRRSGSAALDFAYVAAGRSEAHWEWGLSLHDIAAGLLLVREAGGHTAHLAYPDWPAGHLAANGPAIHAEVLGVVEVCSPSILLAGAALTASERTRR
jgi:myo-inositol-1(or 4)-monophosphatase